MHNYEDFTLICKRYSLAKFACLICFENPKLIGHFCSRSCATNAYAKAPAILNIPQDHETFTDGTIFFINNLPLAMSQLKLPSFSLVTISENLARGRTND